MSAAIIFRKRTLTIDAITSAQFPNIKVSTYLKMTKVIEVRSLSRTGHWLESWLWLLTYIISVSADAVVWLFANVESLESIMNLIMQSIIFSDKETRPFELDIFPPRLSFPNFLHFAWNAWKKVGKKLLSFSQTRRNRIPCEFYRLAETATWLSHVQGTRNLPAKFAISKIVIPYFFHQKPPNEKFRKNSIKSFEAYLVCGKIAVPMLIVVE